MGIKMDNIQEIVLTVGSIYGAISTIARIIPTKEHSDIQNGLVKLLSLLFSHTNTKK